MTTSRDELLRDQIKAHLDLAWPTVVKSLQAQIARGTSLSDLALMLIDNQVIPFDAKRSADCVSRGGFSDGQTVAEVMALPMVSKMAAAAGAAFAAALAAPVPPSVLRVYAITVFGPTTATITYDPDTLTPTLGDA